MNSIALLEIAVYSFTLWFGLYLLAGNWHKAGLRYAGLGLIAYALGIGLALLFGNAESAIAWYYLPFMLPSIFWMAAILYLVPDVPISRVNSQLVLGMLVLLVSVAILTLFAPHLGRFFILLLPLLFLLGALVRLGQIFRSHHALPPRPLAIILTATIFFGLATSLLLLPFQIFAQSWLLLGTSVDLLLLGYGLAVLDAYDEGTKFFAEALRALLAASLLVVLIGGQVFVVIALFGDSTGALKILLFGLITSLLSALAFADTWQGLLDRLSLSKQVQSEREQLRAVANAAIRVDETLPLQQLSAEEFARLTRRALSHYGDLHKLAASPLIYLPQVTQQISEDSLLARANALKALLRESINALKPQSEDEFSTADEWRYYNVLYFPYVLGLKPYSRRYFADELDDKASEAALEWFRTYVPERTLYNWQKSAAELIAQDLQTTNHSL